MWQPRAVRGCWGCLWVHRTPLPWGLSHCCPHPLAGAGLRLWEPDPVARLGQGKAVKHFTGCAAQGPHNGPSHKQTFILWL